MKMIYLANARIPTEKAHGVQIMKMCQAFQKAGLDIKLVVAKRSNPQFKNINPFDYYGISQRFPIKKLWLVDVVGNRFLGIFSVLIPNITFALSAFFHLLFRKADIIYSRDEFSLFLLSFFKNNLILEVHVFPQSKIFLYKWTFKRVKKIVVINNRLKELVVGLGIDSNKVLVAHDGVDLEQFQIKNSKQECRQKLDLPVDKKLAITNSGLFKWKGVYTLAQAAKLLDDNWRIVFIGGMTEEVIRFKKFIKKHNIDKVIVLGHKPYGLMPYYLKAADVLVLPNSAKKKISREWTSPIKMFEQMSSGVPIVASDLPSIKEVLNNKNSVLFEADNPKDLAEKITQTLNNQEIAQSALLDVQEYSWQKRANNIFEFIK